MRKRSEIAKRTEILKIRLFDALDRREEDAEWNIEQNLALLSMLDQLETLLWVLDEPTDSTFPIH